MCDKAVKSTINNMKTQIKVIQKSRNGKEVSRLNSIILGSHNYYSIATYVNIDFNRINFLVTKTLKIRLRNIITSNPNFTETYIRLYGNYNSKVRTVYNVSVFPIYGYKTKPPMNFSQEICNYTERGRISIHNKLKGYSHLIKYLLETVNNSKTAEFNDNRISLIVGQRGKCYITGLDLETDNMECHHKMQNAKKRRWNG